MKHDLERTILEVRTVLKNLDRICTALHGKPEDMRQIIKPDWFPWVRDRLNYAVADLQYAQSIIDLIARVEDAKAALAGRLKGPDPTYIPPLTSSKGEADNDITSNRRGSAMTD